MSISRLRPVFGVFLLILFAAMPAGSAWSEEDVDVWSDNGAIDEDRREAIRAVYRGASPEFQSLHAVRASGDRFVDRMLFVAAAGRKPVRH